MNTKTIAIILFGLTIAAVALVPFLNPQAGTPTQTPPGQVQVPPPANGQRPIIDAVFVLDTTGSMGGLIQAAKDKIWSIASTLAAGQPAPQIRMGLVAYRDRGDDYVTRVVDLSPDLDAMQTALAGLQARGGGDGPEDVNQALNDAVNRISWHQARGAYKVIFLVGDAPPHNDYQGETRYPEILDQARRRGIRVNAIQCGDLGETRGEWQRIAQLGHGSYFRVDQDGSAVAIATPYDDALARLSGELDETRIFYGSKKERDERHAEVEAAGRVKAAAPAPVLARRAGFLASDSGKASLAAKQELVEEVASGKVDLNELPADQLPEPLAALPAPERQAVVQEKAAERERLTKEIKQLAEQRAGYLRKQVEAAGGARDSLDQQLFDAVKVQTEAAGIEYKGDAPAY